MHPETLPLSFTSAIHSEIATAIQRPTKETRRIRRLAATIQPTIFGARQRQAIGISGSKTGDGIHRTARLPAQSIIPSPPKSLGISVDRHFHPTIWTFVLDFRVVSRLIGVGRQRS